MVQLDAPGKCDYLLLPHPKRDCQAADDLAVPDQDCAALQGIFRGPAPEAAAVGIHDQVIAPRHADQRSESAHGGQQGAALDRTCLYQVGMD